MEDCEIEEVIEGRGRLAGAQTTAAGEIAGSETKFGGDETRLWPSSHMMMPPM